MDYYKKLKKNQLIDDTFEKYSAMMRQRGLIRYWNLSC